MSQMFKEAALGILALACLIAAVHMASAGFAVLALVLVLCFFGVRAQRPRCSCGQNHGLG